MRARFAGSEEKKRGRIIIGRENFAFWACIATVPAKGKIKMGKINSLSAILVLSAICICAPAQAAIKAEPWDVTADDGRPASLAPLTNAHGMEVRYLPHGAMSFQTQHYPDSPNHPNFPATELMPEKPFHEITEYRFLAEAR